MRTSCAAPAGPSSAPNLRENTASRTSMGKCRRRCVRSAVPRSGSPSSVDKTPAEPARLAQLLDRQDILDCLIRFSRGMDRFDRDVFLSAFHPDATIAAGAFVGNPPALYDWARKLHEQGQSATHHNLLNHSCDIDSNVAHTETYYLFVGRNRDKTNWIAG